MGKKTKKSDPIKNTVQAAAKSLLPKTLLKQISKESLPTTVIAAARSKPSKKDEETLIRTPKISEPKKSLEKNEVSFFSRRKSPLTAKTSLTFTDSFLSRHTLKRGGWFKNPAHRLKLGVSIFFLLIGGTYYSFNDAIDQLAGRAWGTSSSFLQWDKWQNLLSSDSEKSQDESKMSAGSRNSPVPHDSPTQTSGSYSSINSKGSFQHSDGHQDRLASPSQGKRSRGRTENLKIDIQKKNRTLVSQKNLRTHKKVQKVGTKKIARPKSIAKLNKQRGS